MRILLTVVILLGFPMGTESMAADSASSNQIPTAAVIDGDLAGKGAAFASKAVYRIICQKSNSAGTGFLHKSGKLLTADHVIKGCSEVVVISTSGTRAQATVAAVDEDLDLALLTPQTSITAPVPSLSEQKDDAVGTQVTTWGFPSGYSGFAPLLTMGYLSGLEAFRLPNSRIIKRLVINAAFNQGNSGGPLFRFDTGEVIGVVVSKLAPISPFMASALQVLENQQSGVLYEATQADGSKVAITEGKIVGTLLAELRSQVQLVVGYAVLGENLRDFLKAQNVEP